MPKKKSYRYGGTAKKTSYRYGGTAKKKNYRHGGMSGPMEAESGMTRSAMGKPGYRGGGMVAGSGSGLGRLEKANKAKGTKPMQSKQKSGKAKSGKVTTKRGYGAARKG